LPTKFDPFETFMTAPPGEPSHRKADDQSHVTRR
jgi:hypothetical protein